MENMRNIHRNAIVQNLSELIQDINNNVSNAELLQKLQKMFYYDSNFDFGLIWFIKNSTKNFMKSNKECLINGVPIKLAAEMDANNIEDYINNILMKENEDARGVLLNLVPIVMRINIYILNIDTSEKAKVTFYIIFQKGIT